VTIQFVDKNGYSIIFNVNSTEVPLNISMSPLELGTLDISRGNAKLEAVPTLLGCTADGICKESKPGFVPLDPNGLPGIFGGGFPFKIVLPCVFGGLALVGAVGLAYYIKVVRPLQKIRRARYETGSTKYGSVNTSDV
jgi:hypothetical protein